MSRKYKFWDSNQMYFISFATVHWIDVFRRNGQKEWSLFFNMLCFKTVAIIFALSNKTEVGSAGEQPARDSLMTEINNK